MKRGKASAARRQRSPGGFTRTLLVLFALLAGSSHALPGDTIDPVQEQRPVMGTLFTVQLHHRDGPALRVALDAAFDRAEEIEQAASDYRQDSELTRLNNAPPGKPFELGEDLAALLAESLEIARLSDGAFDPTVGQLSLLWRRARRSQFEPPADAHLRAARRSANWNHLRLTADGRAAIILRADTRLDLGAIGKGFAADAMLDVLAEHGFPRTAVAAAGDIRCGQPPPGQPGWPVQLAPYGEDDGRTTGFRVIARAGQADDFRPEVRLASRATSTSGDQHQFVEHGGQRYSHIIDPRSGWGVTHEQAVIVIAPTATEADALATALNVLGPDIPRKMADHLEQRGCQVWWFERDGSASANPSLPTDDLVEMPAGSQVDRPVSHGR